MRLRPVLGLVIASVIVLGAFSLPARATADASVPLSELPWDDQIPIEVRRTVERAVGEKIKPLVDEKNARGKSYIHAYTADYVEIRDGKPVAWVTLQRCLEDRMVVERWEYVFDKTASGEYKIATETKINELSDSRRSGIEFPSQARPIKPFTFKHDLFTLDMKSGSYIVSYWGGEPTGVIIAGEGTFTAEPLSEYEKTFFVDVLKKDRIATAVSTVEIDFFPGDMTILDKLGYQKPSTPLRFAADKSEIEYGSAPEGLRKAFDDAVDAENSYKPEAYSPPTLEAYKGYLEVTAESAEFGTLLYRFDPTQPREIAIARAKRALSLKEATSQEWDLVSTYPAPESRALTVDQLDRRMSLRYAQPNAFSGFFDIDGDKFIATISADLMILEETDELGFGLGGNPRVRYVRDLDLDEDLPFQPFRSAFSQIYGFEDTFNSYRVKLGRVYKPGEIVRLKLSYNSPDLVYKIDEGFWRVSRGGILPFYEIIGDPAFMTFVMRTKDAYDHVAFGTERRREKRDGYLYTEWGAEHSVLFPTMNVGQFYPVETAEVDGIKILGYATKSAVITDLASPTKGMRQEVEKARSAMEGYQRMYALDYPFDNLKIVSVPKQFYAQAPTTILYMDEIFLQPKGLLGTVLRGDSRGLSGTTAHEAGHQWWGGLVSNVNYLHYWFVEGFAELGSALYLESVEPGSMKVSLEGWRERVFLSDHLCSLMDDWRQGGGVPAPPLRYTKGPYVFLMLGEHFGYDKLTEYMREIMKLHGGDLITTTDLQRIAEHVFGVELDFYWKQWIRENGIPVVGYNLSRPREEGGKWVVDYKLTQRIERNGQVDAGRYFKMVVPMRVEKADGGYQTLKVWIDGPEKSGRLELPFRPKATPEIDPDLRMLFKRERL